ncbi:laccase [Leucogyrophana mollusca]|uniref:Laccase n=1 Tax=Leucogyrophana mollusca TaxID=85980 RepID=A0ACB8BQ09_9AGAM|nr:laccase [Leucogyrophana mollusca]
MIFSALFLSALFYTSNAATAATNVSARSGSGPFQVPLGETPASVIGPVSELSIVNKVVSPDGFSRLATLAGGIFPGPLIKATKGDNFRLNVVNQLEDRSMPLVTSVHWHGIKQHESSWADGVSFVTQCPIPTHDAFLHRFSVPTQTGTYWYHSHFSTQYCDGLRGPLVIYDPHDPLAHMYDVDDESTVITLADWYHVPSPILNNVKGAVIPNATLINGLGRYAGGPSSPLSVINVEQGKRYRFRIIGLSCHPWFNFTIDGHNMTIIETDGVETEPVEVSSLAVYASQRYSVVVTANRPVDNYWIRSLSNLATNGTRFENGQSSAILRYKGAPDQDPTTEQDPDVLPFVEGNLHPLIHPGAPGIPEIGKADVNINLVVGNASGGGLFTINNVSFVNPPAPVLLQILSGKRHALELLPAGSVYTLPPNKVIEISIPASNSAPGGPHPFHLHGHNFDVIRTAGNNTPNFINPPRRDTVSIGAQGDNVTFRFVTDNSGPWFLHCHIDWHLNAGFAVVMAENPNGISAHSEHIPEYWFDLCPANTTYPGMGMGMLN